MRTASGSRHGAAEPPSPRFSARHIDDSPRDPQEPELRALAHTFDRPPRTFASAVERAARFQRLRTHTRTRWLDWTPRAALASRRATRLESQIASARA